MDKAQEEAINALPGFLEMGAALIKHEQPVFHFLMTSAVTWHTGTDLQEMMALMNKEGYGYYIWFVPVDKDAEYEISFFQPQVKGSFVLGFIEPKQKTAKRRRV